MQYHKASILGHERSKKAQLKLFDYTGYAMLTYTTKQVGNGFAPVGEEMLVAKMEREADAMLFLCDNDGYAKAQSKPLPKEKAEEAYKKMLNDGIAEFKGQIKTVS
ncbi:MAG: hypothetical protein QOA08_04345 [Nitrososphaeraceae archaeon]|jgi:hypothetical protein|nr:hypothetical protein [Nitrososphaeraceae archaeon]MDW0264061.1 hypothetical protein [Nitrososphaeraceae archaeon]